MLVAALLVGCGTGAAPRQAAAPTATPAPLIGVTTHYDRDWGGHTFLSRLDPATLRPVGPRAEVPEFHDAWSVSPDGTRVALGTGGPHGGVNVFDARRMRHLGQVRTGIAAEGLGWLNDDRLIALLQSGRVAIVDPRARRVIGERALRSGEGICFAGRATALTDRGLLVMLGARPEQAPRVLLVDARGGTRELELPAGGDWGCSRAGLAYDPRRRRALVVSRGNEVAEIDVGRMRATFHRVGGAPLRRAARQATLLPGGGLLVSGRAGGAGVIDTETWTHRVVDAGAGAARAVGETILTYDGVHRRRGNAGLVAYGADGTRRFHVLRGRRVTWLHVARGRAFAQTERALHAVDLETGRLTTRRLRPRTELLVLG